MLNIDFLSFILLFLVKIIIKVVSLIIIIIITNIFKTSMNVMIAMTFFHATIQLLRQIQFPYWLCLLCINLKAKLPMKLRR